MYMESTKSALSNKLTFPISMLQSAISGYRDLDTNEYLILSHVLLIFKMYNGRTTGYLNINHLLIYIKGIRIFKRNYVRIMQKE